MIFSDKKLKADFRKEIQSLGVLSELKRPLGADEQAGVKQNILSAIAGQTRTAEKSFDWQERKYALMRYVAATLVGLSLVGGTALAAGNSKPGDILYPIKRIKEKVQLTAAVSPEAKANLRANFAQERLKELQELTAEDLTTVNATSSVSSGHTQTDTQLRETVRSRAREDAGKEVKNALDELTKVRANLEAKGDLEAAAAVNGNILRLKRNARLQHILGSSLDEDLRHDQKSEVPTDESAGGASGQGIAPSTEGQLQSPAFGGSGQTDLKLQEQSGSEIIPNSGSGTSGTSGQAEVKDSLNGSVEIK